MNSFSYYLKEQSTRHPSMQPRDVAKLCYQAAFGAEHLLRDRAAAWNYLKRELEATPATEALPLVEAISPEVCRVHLGVWKQKGLPAEWLFSMFVASTTVRNASHDSLEAYLQEAARMSEDGEFAFSPEEWREFAAEYAAAGMPPIHHSDRYREAERPAYRIVRREFAELLPLLERVARILDEKNSCVLAIDGRAAAGKTTLAARLEQILGVDAIHMDDFFLPPPLRTEVRLGEPGGNLHYERVKDEILPYLSTGEEFSYGAFDCSCMAVTGRREIGASRIRVVEGSYSHHPAFGAYADLRVFVTVSPEEQMDRILCRNGEGLAKRFREEWIPMEERYFAAFDIENKADVTM